MKGKQYVISGIVFLAMGCVTAFGQTQGAEGGASPYGEAGSCYDPGENPCPVNVPLTREDLGCLCGDDVLGEEHFKTLSYVVTGNVVLMCKDNKAIRVTFKPLGAK